MEASKEELVIIGGGIIGAMEAYFAYVAAQRASKPIRITIYDKNKSISETTAAHLVPSLSPDEIMSVVPQGQELVQKLRLLFNEPGGLIVNDIADVQHSPVANHFIQQVQKYSADVDGHQARTKTLLELGKFSMNMWNDIYENADSNLKNIFEAANFKSCHDANLDSGILFDGCFITLIYNALNPRQMAQDVKDKYATLGYSSCKILSPTEVMLIDPNLTYFCMTHSIVDATGERQWNDAAIAFWRPGGCIDTQYFLPHFYTYLKNVMGQYTNEAGQSEDCFQLIFSKKVTKVIFNSTHTKIIGLEFSDGSHVKPSANTHYVFCPGEAVGTLKQLGFNEPAYAGFAGPSLMLNIPLPVDKQKQYQTFNHWMEIYEEGVSLAWQARCKDNHIFIGVAGTKAFYGDQKPDKEHVFTWDRNLLQLNMVNDVLPEFLSFALDRDTAGQTLAMQDLQTLEDRNIAKRWVGIRAVAYDGFPTLGAMYYQANKVTNARCTTHLGSGGVSFAPAAVFVSRAALENQTGLNKLTQEALKYSSSER